MNNPTLSPTAARLHPATRLGYIHLTVADLERQIAFYQNVLGFKLHWREGDSVGLGGGGEDLLRLTQVAGAQRARGTTGLYHTAFLISTRWELAHLLRQIAETGTRIQGMVNHRTHLAIYLPDAEGNGIELAWDFPKAEWPSLADLFTLGNLPLEPETLFAELERNPSDWTGLGADTTVGHVHLHVADLDAAVQFYEGVLGFDIQVVAHGVGAAFFSTGGYHHHVGTNTWHGVGAPQPPPNATGLRYFTVVLPNADELERVVERVRAAGIAVEEAEHGYLVRDPAGNGVVLTVLSE